jgi:hypothetical protein
VTPDSRVEIRAPQSTDSPAIDRWLPEALVAVAGGPSGAGAEQANIGWDAFRRNLRRTQTPLLVTRNASPVGLVVTRAGGRGPVCLDILVIEAAQRNLGLGTEAVLLLEAQSGERPILAGVPCLNGLAIYFWLRAGYRPLWLLPRSARLDSGRTWMLRGALSDPSSRRLASGLQ